MAGPAFCSDADVAARCEGDYDVLVATPGRVLARGVDGAIGSEDRWTLTSISNDFAGQGVAAGHVLVIASGSRAQTGDTPDEFEVADVPSGGVTLKRIGEDAGVGFPPGPAGAVQFRVATVGHRIRRVTARLMERFKITLATETELPVALADAACLWVVKDLYLEKARQSDKPDDFFKKYGAFKAELETILRSLDPSYGTMPGGPVRVGALPADPLHPDPARPPIGWPYSGPWPVL
jgi:hypothetical protein